MSSIKPRSGSDFSSLNGLTTGADYLKNGFSAVPVPDRATRLTLEALGDDIIFYEGLDAPFDALDGDLLEYESLFLDGEDI